MGVLFSRLFSYFGDREARILVLGLDNAGKTTILYKMQVGTVVSTIPTIGFNTEEVQYKNIRFSMWDVGGQGLTHLTLATPVQLNLRHPC